MKCAIQWIDSNGTPTPDTNDAIGLAESTFFYTGHYRTGETVREVFPICAEHAKRMPAGPSVCEHYRSSWALLPQTEVK